MCDVQKWPWLRHEFAIFCVCHCFFLIRLFYSTWNQVVLSIFLRQLIFLPLSVWPVFHQHASCPFVLDMFPPCLQVPAYCHVTFSVVLVTFMTGAQSMFIYLSLQSQILFLWKADHGFLLHGRWHGGRYFVSKPTEWSQRGFPLSCLSIQEGHLVWMWCCPYHRSLSHDVSPPCIIPFAAWYTSSRHRARETYLFISLSSFDRVLQPISQRAAFSLQSTTYASLSTRFSLTSALSRTLSQLLKQTRKRVKLILSYRNMKRKSRKH